MRRLIALAPLLVTLLSLPSYAGEAASDPCVLLDWHDFESMGITRPDGLESSQWNHEEPPAELPGSSLSTGLCAAVTRTDKGRKAMTLNLSSVKGNVTEAQFDAWLHGIAAASTHANAKEVKEFKVDGTDCESGRDEAVIPALYEGDDDTTVNEYFVACDQHVGLVHVSMNAQVAEGRRDELPDAAQVKSLLDKSVARLKETGFRTPD